MAKTFRLLTDQNIKTSLSEVPSDDNLLSEKALENSVKGIFESLTRPQRTDRNIIFEGNSRTSDWVSRTLKEGIPFATNTNSFADSNPGESIFENRGFYSYPHYLMQLPNFKNRFNYYNVAMWGASNTYSWWAGILTDAKYFDDVYPHRPEANGGEVGISESWLFIQTGIIDIFSSNPTSVASLISAKRAYLLRAKADGFNVVVLGEYFGYSSTYRVPNDETNGVCQYGDGVNNAELARVMYNNAMMEMAAKGEIDMYIDLDHLFTPNLRADSKDLYHYDTIAHLTGAAHQLIAEYVNSLFSAAGNLHKVAYNRFVNLPELYKKVDKVTGKGLSTNDFTTVEKNKLASLQPSLTSAPFSNIKQVMYRNLEGDNMLPTADYSGRLRPIQTPITLVSTSDGYLVKNMPYVRDLVLNPSNWILFNADYSGTTDHGSRIVEVEYMGTVGSDTDCCRIYTYSAISATTGNRMGIFAWNAYGTYIKLDNRPFPLNTGNWNKTYTQSLGAAWKSKLDNKYYALVTGWNNTVTTAYRASVKLFTTDDYMSGSWTSVNGLSTGCDIRSLIPAPYVGCSPLFSIGKIPGKDGMYFSILSLYNSSNTLAATGMLIWNEDFTYKKIFLLNIDFSFTNGAAFWASSCFYKGKYLIAFGDGTQSYNTGKRWVFASNNIEGQYTEHSFIYDFAEIGMLQAGSLFSYSIANGSLFVYNDSLYYISSGSSNDTLSGVWSNHEAYLWQYNDAKNTWHLIVAPLIMTPHGLSKWEFDESNSWAWDHMGPVNPHFIEDGKLYFGTAFCAGTDSYQGTVGYIDLNEALK